MFEYDLDVKEVSKNRAWGVFGGPKDLDDGWDSRVKELYEYDFVEDPNWKCKKGLYYDKNFKETDQLIIDTRGKSGYGAEMSWKGLYRVMPFRETESF